MAVTAAFGIGSTAFAAFPTLQSGIVPGTTTPITFTPQGYSSFSAQINANTGVLGTNGATLDRNYGGVVISPFSGKAFSYQDTYSPSVSSAASSASVACDGTNPSKASVASVASIAPQLASSLGSVAGAEGFSNLVFGPPTGQYDQSPGEIQLAMLGGGTGAFKIDGSDTGSTAGSLVAFNNSQINMTSSKNVTGNVGMAGNSFATNGNVNVWTGNWNTTNPYGTSGTTDGVLPVALPTNTIPNR